MLPYDSLLEETLEAWRFTRKGVIEEVDNLPEEEFGFRPTPDNRTVAELVQHIIETGLMMSGELSRRDGDFQRKSFAEFIQEYAGHVKRNASKLELLRLLEMTHLEGEARLREAGELRLLQFIQRFDGQEGTRLAWLQHGIAHEEYHRGQLALYARLLGRVPALTRRIVGE
jgi:uncharacterized damage-inducible protein DinB